MKIVLAVNHEDIEKYVSKLNDVEVTHILRDKKDIVDACREGAELIIISNELPGEENIKEILLKLTSKEYPRLRIAYIYGAEDSNKKEFINFLIMRGIYDYHINSELNQEDLDKLIFAPKTREDVRADISNKFVSAADSDAEVVIQEKIVEKIIEIEGERPDSFKKLILTIWDNAEFGCELAYMAAKLSGLEVLLVDADLLSPKADLILNVKKNPENIKTEGMYTDSGFNIIMDTIEKNVFTPAFFSEACINRKELKNLHILTGNFNLENYEYYSKDSYKIFLEKCYHAFDITILLVNRSIYDLFSLISLSKSDYNLIATKADVLSIRDFNSQIVFLHEKQQIDINKFKFIGFEYAEDLCMKKSDLEESTENNYLGHISYSKKRITYRNLKAPYVRRMPISQVDEYKDILAYFKVMPKQKFMDKFRSRSKRMKLKLRSFVKKLKPKFKRKRR